MNLNIIEWNINQRARKENIPNFIFDELITRDADIVVLTEFDDTTNSEQFLNTFKNCGYNYVKTNNDLDQNQIAILVKNNIKINNSNSYKSKNNNAIPNMILVNCEFNNTVFSMLGVRIRIGTGNKEDYESRKKQMSFILTESKKISNPLVMIGDFNNLRINTPIKPWNLSVLDNFLKKQNLKRHTPNNKHSWGVKYNAYKHQLDGYISNDHLVTSSSIRVKHIDYDWGFVERNKYQIDNKVDIYNQKRILIPVGFPDHAILISNIIIK